MCAEVLVNNNNIVLPKFDDDRSKARSGMKTFRMPTANQKGSRHALPVHERQAGKYDVPHTPYEVIHQDSALSELSNNVTRILRNAGSTQ